MKKKNFKGISTVTLHSANTENDNFSHTTPIYATSTFTFDSTDEGMERFKSTDKTRIYSRWGNPTFTAAQDVIAALESFGSFGIIKILSWLSNSPSNSLFA